MFIIPHYFFGGFAGTLALKKIGKYENDATFSKELMLHWTALIKNNFISGGIIWYDIIVEII